MIEGGGSSGGMSGGSMGGGGATSPTGGSVSFGAVSERSGGGRSPTFSSKGFASFGKATQVEGMVSLSHNPKVAHSEAIAFKGMGRRPMIDIKQNKDGVAYRFSSEKKLQSLSAIDRKSKSTQKQIKPYESHEENKLASTRQKLNELIKNDGGKNNLKNDLETKVRPTTSSRKENSTQRVLESYQKLMGKPLTHEPKGVQERKQFVGPKIKTPADTPEVKPLLTRVKTDDSSKAKEIKAPLTSTERFRQIFQEKANAKAKVSADKIKPQLFSKEQRIGQVMEARQMKEVGVVERVKGLVIERVRAMVAEKVKPQVLSKEHVQEKVTLLVTNAMRIESQPKTEALQSSAVSPQTKLETIALEKTAAEALTRESVLSEVKTQMEIDKEAQIHAETQTPVATEDEKKMKQDDDKKEEPKKKTAFFERDDKANKRRKLEVLNAYVKAKLDTFATGKMTVKGADIAENLDASKLTKAESASIENIEPDGSLDDYVGYLAQAGEIVTVNDLLKETDKAERYYTATNLTEKPMEEVVDVRQIMTVHNNKEQFLAWMDKKPTVVKIKDGSVEVGA